ncbi:uncharacterized protein DFL_005377 [Arthrobotrys flagrans]|uniref:Uncharacterized protein n=1 Tax=Arthrobotrys flagrans TaxID=97331 RepID=A0A437A7G5_ARTFL|nr:hypothetical protein DFL_005377 [Arthrobotrys flagrans]
MELLGNSKSELERKLSKVARSNAGSGLDLNDPVPKNFKHILPKPEIAKALSLNIGKLKIDGANSLNLSSDYLNRWHCLLDSG